ncbi:putative restriction endonuclease [Cannes 8 virus]|nr:putative restriction endonuclease [Cannes 8 virus]
MDCATRKKGKLCGKKICEHCFKRCFASCEKSKYLAEGQGEPFLIAKHSHKTLPFVCPTCEHEFEAKVNDVSRGQWCSYCSNKKLCETPECETCFEKSFASHAKAKHWSNSNKKTARQTFLHSRDKVWIDCDECTHVFESMVNSVSNSQWCPYCSNPPQKLCDSLKCETCFKNSFASHAKARCWSDKNKKLQGRLFCTQIMIYGSSAKRITNSKRLQKVSRKGAGV